MNQFNRMAQMILLFLIMVWIAGIFIVPSWPSYLAGSFVMYIMCSLVLKKMKKEAEELQLKYM